MSTLQPFYEQVQAHYDLSNEFFGLFLDPSMTYSCAYFERENMTLAEAQLAKIDLSLDKCHLHHSTSDGDGDGDGDGRRLRLLDIGCGWGAAVRRAASRFGVDVVGLTLSRNQHQYAMDFQIQQNAMASAGRRGAVEFRLQGWEEFDEPVDRIITIGAFEHFRIERYSAFFARCKSILPADGAGGRMLLHTIVMSDWDSLRRNGIAVEHEHVLFAKFIRRRIFPGGQLPTAGLIIDHAQRAGFQVELVQSLRPHYARTLDCWAANLQAQREQAIDLTSPEVYATYMRYFTGCAGYFRSGHIDVMQFTLSTQS